MFHGILNVLKPPGMTSHDVVSFIRRTYGLKRVGHAGTLDPAAAGVLPVFLGQATRLIEYQTEADKSYRAELTFGYTTDTGDDTGKIIEEKPVSMPNEQTIRECLASFIGTIEQMPPMYSAIKVEGKKLYELARAGITIERQPRSVTIHAISLVSVGSQSILFDVTCSKGTYVRTLCLDIGQKLNIPAVMSFLVRTRVGEFHLSSAYSLEEIAVGRDKLLISEETAVSHLEMLILNQADSAAFRNGRRVFCSGNEVPAEEQLQRVYDHTGKFIGIALISGQAVTPQKVFHPDDLVSI